MVYVSGLLETLSEILVSRDNNEYWDEVIKETNDFYKKYKEIELAENIALAFINTLAKISKKIMR